ncbi:MAG: cytochrome c-type biogenesis protein [Burkholderiales bacterium]
MRLLLLLAALASPWAVIGKEAAPLADDPVLEKRVMALAEELRCLVCQNESLASSHAELALDLRHQIRVQMRQGKSDRQILDYMVARYGDFVRFRPAVKNTTLVLWLGPFFALGAGAIALYIHLKRRERRICLHDLSDAERKRVAALLGDGSP